MDPNKNIEEILKNLGAEEVPAEVHKISEESSQAFTTALRVLTPKLDRSTHIGNWPVRSFQKRAFGAGTLAVTLAFVVGVGLGRWSKGPGITPKPESTKQFYKLSAKRLTYALKDNGESFWRAKMIASLKPKSYPEGRPHMRDGTLWGKYTEYIKEHRYE